MRDTGYGSALLLRACRVAPAWRRIAGRGPRATWARLRAGSALLLWYRLTLPSTRIRLTASPAGRMIGEHFAIREGRRRRFCGAQGVLALPAEFSQYMRGHHRQAVRTNVGHAREAAFTVESCTIDNWAPGPADSRATQIAPGPVERWMVVDADRQIVADSILSVDDDVALLHGLVSTATYARWLLHTAIVERLCGSCDVLLTNSDDVYLMDPGNRHFQRLLGYRISRLRLSRPARPRTAALSRPAAPPLPPGPLSPDSTI